MSDRKYRHRGYMDSGRDERPADRGPRGPREPAGPSRSNPTAGTAPRGRSVGRDAEAVFKCGRCGEIVVALDELGPASTCAKCGKELHTCQHCRHYDPQARWECTQPIPEAIQRKTKSNACTFFEPKIALDLTGKKPERGADDARTAFDKLFSS